MPKFTLEDLKKYDGLDGRPLYLTINGKVRQYLGDLEVLKDYNHRYNRLRRNYGPHIEYFFASVFYDPKYGLPKSINEFTHEHANYLEDWHVNYKDSEMPIDKFKTVGFFDQKYKD